ncbi:MAG: TVP38/TMEM64 family protein [Spirochaetota bacterium]
MKREIWVRIASLVVLIVGTVGLYRWFVAVHGPVNWAEVFSSRENFRDFVSRFNPYGPLVFFVIQAAQVVVAPVPGNITALAGGALYGLWPGFLISTAGLVVGSIAAFGIARFYGRPLVERFVKPSVVDKYIDTVANKHFVLLFLIFLFPFFPDDALCLIAGISALPFHVFLLLVVLGRPPGMFMSSLVGAGIAVVPWWGWVLIAGASGTLLYFAYRYKDALDRKLGMGRDGAPRGDESP